MTPGKNATLFGGFDLFKGIEPETLDALDLTYSVQQFNAGQIIIEQGDDNRDVFFLSQGRLLAVLWTEDGKELVYTSTPVGAHLGEIAAIDGGDRSLTVYAFTKAEVVTLKQECFAMLMEQNKQFRENVLNALVARIRDLTNQKFELVNFSVSQRVRSYLARLALNAMEFKVGGVLQPAPTHHEISNSIGANREAVSRAISQLNKEAVIAASRQSVTILSPEALVDGLDGRLE